MKVLVLGSSGQIGSYLSQHLRNIGHEVIEYDIQLGPEYDLRVIPNTHLDGIVNGCDFVFFLAFDVGGAKYLRKYQHTFNFINNNTRIMTNVFCTLQKFQTPFIFASSQMSNMTHSSYGVLKHLGELYTKTLCGLTLKFWNIYGIEKDYEKSHVITDFIKKGLENGSIHMITDGTEERQFLYAQDCCEALETIMNHYGEFSPDDELHVTSGISTTIIDIAKEIQTLFRSIGRDIDIIPSESLDDVQKNAKNMPNLYIRNWWKPKTSLKNGIGKIFDNMVSESF